MDLNRIKKTRKDDICAAAQLQKEGENASGRNTHTDASLNASSLESTACDAASVKQIRTNSTGCPISVPELAASKNPFSHAATQDGVSTCVSTKWRISAIATCVQRQLGDRYTTSTDAAKSAFVAPMKLYNIKVRGNGNSYCGCEKVQYLPETIIRCSFWAL